MKDENGDLTEIKGSSNQVRKSPVQTTKDSGRASQDVSLPIFCPLVTSFLPQNYLKEGVQQISAVQKCSGSRGGLLRFRLAFTVSLCPPRLSFQWSNQVVREAGSLPEAERTAWVGSLPVGARLLGVMRTEGRPHRNRQGQGSGERKLQGDQVPFTVQGTHRGLDGLR